MTNQTSQFLPPKSHCESHFHDSTSMHFRPKSLRCGYKYCYMAMVWACSYFQQHHWHVRFLLRSHATSFGLRHGQTLPLIGGLESAVLLTCLSTNRGRNLKRDQWENAEAAAHGWDLLGAGQQRGLLRYCALKASRSVYKQKHIKTSANGLTNIKAIQERLQVISYFYWGWRFYDKTTATIIKVQL